MSYTSLTFLLFGIALLWSAMAFKVVGAMPSRPIMPQSTPVEVAVTPSEEWLERPFRDLTAAENFLDWLEAEGFADREFATQQDGSFAVRWRS